MTSKLYGRAALAAVAGAFVLGAAASGAWAEGTSPSRSSQSPAAQSQPSPSQSQMNRSADRETGPAKLGGMSMQNLVGKPVVNSAGREVGDISDFVADINDKDSRVTYAVIGVGGFLGLGEKDVAIPIEQLQVSGDKVILSSNMTEDQLKQMPEFDRTRYRSVMKSGDTTGDAAPRGTQPRRD